MTSGNSKFFFEEDSDDLSTGVNAEEQADIFGSGLEELGLSGGPDSMEPMDAVTVRMEMKEIKSTLLLINYGVTGKDYVLHVEPLHPQKNFTEEHKLRLAIDTIMIAFNKVVPFDIRVEIGLPREDYEVKVLTFIARGGAEAWNLNTEDLDKIIEGDLGQALSNVCMK